MLIATQTVLRPETTPGGIGFPEMFVVKNEECTSVLLYMYNDTSLTCLFCFKNQQNKAFYYGLNRF